MEGGDGALVSPDVTAESLRAKRDRNHIKIERVISKHHYNSSVNSMVQPASFTCLCLRQNLLNGNKVIVLHRLAVQFTSANKLRFVSCCSSFNRILLYTYRLPVLKRIISYRHRTLDWNWMA